MNHKNQDERGVMDFLQFIKQGSNIVILTGAGISAESGLKTFRAADGLWEGHRVEDVATPEAFIRNPDLVYKFYNERRAALLSSAVRENAAHIALAKLQQEWPKINGGRVTIVTQNIDDLHERGGAKDVIHMHGELLKMFCTHCAQEFQGDFMRGASIHESAKKLDITESFDGSHHCPDCGQNKSLRPDIVWFGEMPYRMDEIYEALEQADLFLSIGTSGHVYPAAGFTTQAQFAGARTIEINLEPSLNAGSFHEGHYGPATIKVPEFVERIRSWSP